MLTNYPTKLIRPPIPGTPTAVCPACGVRGHVVKSTSYGGKSVVAGCRCQRTPAPVPPSEGTARDA